MKTISRYIMTLALLLTAVTGAWADGIACTASDLGKVLCTDGSIYENVSAANTAGKTAEAVIAYVDETNKNGLALALTDIPYFYTWDNTGSYNEKKTAPEICSALNTSKAVTGGTWKLPSQDEWKQMFSANGGNEGSYTGLNTAIGNAGGTALKEGEDYWSSSEFYSDAWLVHLSDGNASWNTDGKHYGRMVRACLAFDIADPITVEPVTGQQNQWTFTMPGSDVVLTPIYAPTKVTLAANDVQKGSVEVAGESKVEWTADTWKGWTADIKEYTVDDITMTSSESAHIREYTSENESNNSLFFFVRQMIDDATVTFSTTGDPFSRIEFTMIGDYSERNPNIIPNDNWTFEGKSAVWEGEATKSLTLQSCSTNVSKITFYKGAAIPEGVTVNTDGTFTVAQTATVKVKAIPAEGYKLKGWSDAPDCTDLVREITIEPGEEDMIITATFEEMTYTATFTAANANTIEAGKATVTVDDQPVTVTDGKLEGVKMGSEVKLEAKPGYKFRKVEVKKGAETPAVQARTWNFTQWSEATVNNIKADAAASKTEGWSDIEKEKDAKDGKSAGETEDKCFWYQGEVNSDGTLSANGSVIEELKGLKFNEEYASRRDLAIAVDYSSTSLGDYAGGAYLMLGGGKVQSPDKRICCFTIPNVKIGQKITVVVESHKPSTGRGISLFVNSVKDDGNKIGDSFMPTTKESYTWENWTLPDGITADGDTVDILVYNNDVCHIYSITVE